MGEQGGCDGSTWPTLGNGAEFWQDIATVPGRDHVIRFAMRAKSDYVGSGSGDGTQRKSYLYIQDCLDAMLHVIGLPSDGANRVHLYNLGTGEFSSVVDSVRWISEHLGVKPRLDYSGGDRGWIGDVPFIFLDTAKIRATGWQPKLSIQQSIVRTVEWLMENQWVLAAREAGHEAMDGLGLLVHQARRSLMRWTGREVPVEPLARAVGWRA